MNVGVFMPGFTPQTGGGYTFENEVFGVLVTIAKESQHQFTIFGDFRQDNSARTQPSDKVQYMNFYKPDLRERIRARLKQQIYANYFNWRHADTLSKRAREARIEFMWFLGPRPMQIDLPYLAIVWDLQHRLQPWFPEVQKSAEWDCREVGISRFLRRAAFIVTGTNAGKEEIEFFFQIPAERISVIPYPTPSFSLNPTAGTGKSSLKKYGLPDSYLLYPAQFWAHKNHANLLMAVRALKDAHNLTIPVVLVGSDKGNLAYCQNLASSLGIRTQTYFLGFVSREDLVVLYRNALALTYVSYFGPDNLPPLEAFALGCPVIAANVAGAKEQLSDAALLVDPSSPLEIAGAIKAIHDNPDLRAQLAEKGLIRASKWTGTNFVRAVFSILDDFVSIRRCWGS